jgi:ABC-2 type transport system permease protein
VNAARLALFQVRYVNRSYWRNPSRAFFTFAFPLMFLLIFTSLLGQGEVHVGARVVKSSTYYVAAMATFGVITACFNNIAISLSVQRESGLLKRIAGTPLPPSSFVAAQVMHAMLVSVLLVAITAAFGAAAYGAAIPGGVTLLEFLVMLGVAAIAFCALGLAVTALIPNADAAPAVVNIAILPLLFLSGIFIAFGDSTPQWITWVARIFPIRHFATGMQAAFAGTPFDWSDVAVVAGWGALGLLLAVRFFSWEPRR